MHVFPNATALVSDIPSHYKWFHHEKTSITALSNKTVRCKVLFKDIFLWPYEKLEMTSTNEAITAVVSRAAANKNSAVRSLHRGARVGL